MPVTQPHKLHPMRVVVGIIIGIIMLVIAIILYHHNHIAPLAPAGPIPNSHPTSSQ